MYRGAKSPKWPKTQIKGGSYLKRYFKRHFFSILQRLCLRKMLCRILKPSPCLCLQLLRKESLLREKSRHSQGLNQDHWLKNPYANCLNHQRADKCSEKKITRHFSDRIQGQLVLALQLQALDMRRREEKHPSKLSQLKCIILSWSISKEQKIPDLAFISGKSLGIQPSPVARVYTASAFSQLIHTRA